MPNPLFGVDKIGEPVKAAPLPSTLAASGIVLGLPPAGTMAANGAVTFGTALAAVVSGYFYYPAGAIVSGSVAGLYWTAMTSTTAGVVYNNRYISGNPSVPAELVPFVGAGPGAFGLTPTTPYALLSLTVPGGTMGAMGRVRAHLMSSCNSGAGGKTWQVYFGGALFYNVGLNNVQSAEFVVSVVNRGVTNRQVGSSANNAATFNFTNQPLNYTSIDTTVDQTLQFIGTLNNAASDWLMLDSSLVEVLASL